MKISNLLLPAAGLMLAVLAGCQCPTAKSTSCKQSSSATACDFSKLAGTEWQLTRWTDADGEQQSGGAITLAISADQRVSGSAGVNRYTGPLKLAADGGMDFSGGLVVTRKMGLPAAQEREDRYLRDLQKTSLLKLANSKLILSGGGATLEFSPLTVPTKN